MEKKDRHNNSEEANDNSRLEELAEKGTQGLLNAEEQKEYFALVKAQNTASDPVEANPADTATLQNEKAVAADEQYTKAEEFKAQLEDGVETDTQYLQHAPEEFKALWETASQADKEVYKKHVEFTEDGPNIIGASGTKYELAKENLTVADEDLQEGKIDTHNGETYFAWDAMMDYTKKYNISVPTDEMYLDMLKVMPAGDIKEKFKRGAGGRQLFSILGGKLNGSLSDGNHNNNDHGSLWSASHYDDCSAIALRSHGTGGRLDFYPRDTQFPARSLRTPK